MAFYCHSISPLLYLYNLMDYFELYQIPRKINCQFCNQAGLCRTWNMERMEVKLVELQAEFVESVMEGLPGDVPEGTKPFTKYVCHYSFYI